MTESDKSKVAAAMKAAIRELADSLRGDEKKHADVVATLIENDIPADSKHPSGIEARKYAALARNATSELKGEILAQKAIAHHKDFLLLDDAIVGERSREAHSRAGSAPRKLTVDQQNAIANEYLNRKGEYGAVKEIAGRYNVTEQTVRNIAGKSEKNKIAK